MAGAAAALLLTSAAAAPGTTSPPAPLSVSVVSINGSGCPQGTASVSVSSDTPALEIRYSAFNAAAGPGTSPTGSRKNCQIILGIRPPAGFTYAVSGVSDRGYADLERGATALVQSTYDVQGSPEQTVIPHRFTGPLHDEWTAVDRSDGTSAQFAPCGALRYLNIDTEVRTSLTSTDHRRQA
jgi:hypothetical protein